MWNAVSDNVVHAETVIIISYKPCGQYNAWVKPDTPNYQWGEKVEYKTTTKKYAK